MTQLELVRRAELQPLERQRADDHLLDGVVGQHLRRTALEPVGRQPAQPELAQRAHGRGRHAQIGDGRQRALRHGVHHARLGQHVDDVAAGRAADSSAPASPTRPITVRSTIGSPSSSRAMRSTLRAVESAFDQDSRAPPWRRVASASSSSAASAAKRAAARSGWPSAG